MESLSMNMRGTECIGSHEPQNQMQFSPTAAVRVFKDRVIEGDIVIPFTEWVSPEQNTSLQQMIEGAARQNLRSTNDT